MEQFHEGQLVGFGGGECVIERITRNFIKLVGHDIAVDPTALTPLEPRVGDTVRVIEKHPYNVNRLTRGDEFQWTGGGEPEEDGFRWFTAKGACKVILLRRASPPAEVKERKFYGSQPSELPRTLPAGTKWKNSQYQGEFTHAAPMNSCGNYSGHMTFRYKGSSVDKGGIGAAEPGWVDWSTVEIQPAPTSAGEAVAAGWVPKVGDWVEGVGYRLGRMPNMALRGEITEISVGASYAMIQGPDCRPVSLERSSLKPISPPPAGSAPVDAGAQRAASSAAAKAQPVGGGSSTKGSCPHCAQHGCLETSRPCVNCGTQVTCQNVLRDFADGWLCASRACREVSIYHDMLDIDRKRKEGVGTVANPDALDRLAASRKLAQTKQAMDRPAVERHPREWPEGAGDEQELYVS